MSDISKREHVVIDLFFDAKNASMSAIIPNCL